MMRGREPSSARRDRLGESADLDQLRKLTASVMATASSGGAVDPGVLAALDARQRELCAELERRRRRVRASTEKQIETVEKLLKLMRGYEPDIVVGRVRSALGVGRARAYKLMKLARESTEKSGRPHETLRDIAQELT